MSIDVYAEGIFEGHDGPKAKAFEEAVAARERETTPEGAKKAQAAVEAAYDAIYAEGYMREAYHGGPYVTRYLVAEAFDEDKAIPAAVLRERLPVAVLLAIYREQIVYRESVSPPGVIEIGDSRDLLGVVVSALKEANSRDPSRDIIDKITPEQREQAARMIAAGSAPDCAKQFVRFVEQCEAHEKATGKPTMIHVSA